MTIAANLAKFLEHRHIDFQMISHRPTGSSLQSARAAHVPPSQLAKAVLLDDGEHLLLTVVPASCHVQLGDLRKQLGRPVRMAEEHQIAEIFDDCAPGAIPAVGPAYGLETILDEQLVEQPQVYFEAGDHEHLLRMEGGDFVAMLRGCKSGRFCTPITD